MNYIKLGGMVLLACLIADTHAASPKPSGFLKDYSQLVEGEYLEAVWADMPAIQRSEAPEIMLGDIAMVGVSDGKDVSVTDCVSWLKRDILSGNIVSEQRDAPYRLELAITIWIRVAPPRAYWPASLAPGMRSCRWRVGCST